MKRILPILYLIIAMPLFAKAPQIVTDAKKSAEWISKALVSSGYKADFSVESLKEIERFFNEHSEDGKAKPDGLLSEQLGNRLFSIGSYVGEVIIRNHGGKWKGDDSDPESEVNIEVISKNGWSVRPVQKTIKRFQNGSEDSLYLYVTVLTEYDSKTK